MTFTSSELNVLILKYLQEAGMEHSAFVFANESEVKESSLMSADITSGALVGVVQKGLYYIEAEAKALDNQKDSSGKEEGTISLIDGAIQLSRQVRGEFDPQADRGGAECSQEPVNPESASSQASAPNPSSSHSHVPSTKI